VKGELLLDLPYAEDSIAEVDMNVVATGAGQFVEVQGTGEHGTFSRDELARAHRARAARHRGARAPAGARGVGGGVERRRATSVAAIVIATGQRGQAARDPRDPRGLPVALRSLADLPGRAARGGRRLPANAIGEGARVAARAPDSPRSPTTRASRWTRSRGDPVRTRRATAGRPRRRGSRRAAAARAGATVRSGARGARFVCVAALATPGARSRPRAASARARSSRRRAARRLRLRPGVRAARRARLDGRAARRAQERDLAPRARVRALRGAIARALAPAHVRADPPRRVGLERARRWQGQADPPLSARGARRPRRSRALARERADALLCSDLRRARRRRRSSARARPRAAPDPRLRELDVGRWAGLTRSEIAALDPDLLPASRRRIPTCARAGAESRAQIRARVRRAFREIAREHAGRHVLVVTHLGVVRALRPGTLLENAESVPLSANEIPPPPD
jgi:broad specificity phosphatase PhoE